VNHHVDAAAPVSRLSRRPASSKGCCRRTYVISFFLSQTFTRFKVPVHHFFDAAPGLQALKAQGYVKQLRWKFGVQSNDARFTDEDLLELGAKELARGVKVDDINAVAIGFRPPGQWERDQLGANYILWHTPYFVGGPQAASLIPL
jgi:hypothetical protein